MWVQPCVESVGVPACLQPVALPGLCLHSDSQKETLLLTGSRRP